MSKTPCNTLVGRIFRPGTSSRANISNGKLFQSRTADITDFISYFTRTSRAHFIRYEGASQYCDNIVKKIN